MNKFLLLIISIHILILSLLNFTAWPEMLSYPFLFANGFTLYKDFIVPYPPYLIWLLAFVFNTVGFNPLVLKLITWILIIITDIILFTILRKICQNLSFLLVLMFSYIVLQSFLDGNMLWFDFATIVPVLSAFYFLLNWLNKKNNFSLLLISLFLTIAVLIKQVALVYLAGFFLIYISQIKRNIFPGFFYFLSGIFIAIIPVAVYIFETDSISEFWKWTVLYPITEWSKFPGYVNYRIPMRELLMTVLLVLPIVSVLVKVKKIIHNPVFISSLIFFIAAIIAIYPRFSYFHLQPVLVFWIILISQLYLLQTIIFKKVYMLIICMITFSAIFLTYRLAVGNNIRFYETSEKQMASIISSLTSSGERTYLLGLNSSLYVYSDTLPPKNWGDNFGWYLEIPGVQEWVISGMETNPPQLVFWKKPKPGNWFDLGSYQPLQIASYIQTNYHKIGELNTGVEIWQRR